MWKRALLIILLFLKILCQANENIARVDSAYKSSDSCIVFVTTRSVNVKNGEYVFGNTIAKDNLLRFYNIYFKGGESKMAPRSSLAEAINNANVSPDFVVYTEGHGKLFSDNVERGIQASRIYSVSVIMFDWPSKMPGYKVEKNFYTSMNNSRAVAKQFNELLLLLGHYKNNTNQEKIRHLSLFFHSMGNYVILNTLKQYGSKNYNATLVDNIILNAPCIPSREHSKWLEQLTFQRNIYVMYNKKDPALKGASFLMGKFLLGLHPMHLAKNAEYLDLRKVAHIYHNCFLRQSLLSSHPKVREIYNDLFHSRILDVHDVCIESVGGTNNKYCVF
jgi:hypothetical protein